jgi:hypothetical protein
MKNSVDHFTIPMPEEDSEKTQQFWDQQRRILERMKKKKLKPIGKEDKWEDRFVAVFNQYTTFLDLKFDVKDLNPMNDSSANLQRRRSSLISKSQLIKVVPVDPQPGPTANAKKLSRVPTMVKSQDFDEATQEVNVLEKSKLIVEENRDIIEHLRKKSMPNLGANAASHALIKQMAPDAWFEAKMPFYPKLRKNLETEVANAQNLENLADLRKRMVPPPLNYQQYQILESLTKATEEVRKQATKGEKTLQLLDELQSFKHKSNILIQRLQGLRSLLAASSKYTSNSVRDDSPRPGGNVMNYVMKKQAPLQENQRMKLRRELLRKLRSNEPLAGPKLTTHGSRSPSQANASGKKSIGVQDTQHDSELHSMKSKLKKILGVGQACKEPVKSKHPEDRIRAQSLQSISVRAKGESNRKMAWIFDRLRSFKKERKCVVQRSESRDLAKLVKQRLRLETKVEVLESLAFTQEDRKAFDAMRAKNARLRKGAKLETIRSALLS